VLIKWFGDLVTEPFYLTLSPKPNGSFEIWTELIMTRWTYLDLIAVVFTYIPGF